MTTARAAQLIQKPKSEAQAVLERLVEAGLVEARGEPKGRAYHLSPSTYRRLDEQGAYVRLRGFEPFQQENMILQYVQAQGRITRRQSAELCRVSSSQARHLLARLVRQGRLRVEGKTRGAFYVGEVD